MGFLKSALDHFSDQRDFSKEHGENQRGNHRYDKNQRHGYQRMKLRKKGRYLRKDGRVNSIYPQAVSVDQAGGQMEKRV